MRMRCFLTITVILAPAIVAGCNDGGSDYTYTETKDALTGSTIYSASTQQQNETETLVGEVIISCTMPSRQATMEFKSFTGKPNEQGLLPGADAISARHQARLGDWEPSELGSFGLLIAGQKFNNMVTWDLTASVHDYRVLALLGGTKDLVTESAMQIVDKMGGGSNGLHYGALFYRLNFLANDTGKFDAVQRGESAAQAAARADTLKTVLLANQYTPVARVLQWLTWDEANKQLQKDYPLYETSARAEKWATCQFCQGIITSLKAIEDTMVAAKSLIGNDVSVKEFESLGGQFEPATGGFGMGSAFSKLPGREIPSNATTSVQSFLSNRKELVISYDDSNGKNVVTVDFNSGAIQKVLNKCK